VVFEGGRVILECSGSFGCSLHPLGGVEGRGSGRWISRPLGWVGVRRAPVASEFVLVGTVCVFHAAVGIAGALRASLSGSASALAIESTLM
jgi:hypothetical protein